MAIINGKNYDETSMIKHYAHDFDDDDDGLAWSSSTASIPMTQHTFCFGEELYCVYYRQLQHAAANLFLSSERIEFIQEVRSLFYIYPSQRQQQTNNTFGRSKLARDKLLSSLESANVTCAHYLVCW